MIGKFVRIILVLLLVALLSALMPRLYRTIFETSEHSPTIEYSEVLDDFLLIRLQQDSLTKKYYNSAVDSKGNNYSHKEIQALTPVKNFKQLEYEGRFPDSICGMPVTIQMVQESFAFPSFIGVSIEQKSPLLWMFESNFSRDIELPADLFRITKKGIEFIDVKTNKVNKEKSKLFTNELLAVGYLLPSKITFGMTSLRKTVDEGYFSIDSKDNLFHIKMVDGNPVVKRVNLPDNITPLSMNCTSGGYFLGYFYDTNMNIYLMLNDGNYTLKKLPIDDYAKFGSTIVVESNLFYTTFSMTSASMYKKYIFDGNFNLKKAYELPRVRYEQSEVADRENIIFPVKLTISRDGEIIFKKMNFSRAVLLNIALVLILIGIKVYNRRKLLSLFNIIDIAIVAVTGIFGFIAVLVFPNRK